MGLPVAGELEGEDALKLKSAELQGEDALKLKSAGGERRKKRGGHEALHEVDLLRSGQPGASRDT